MLHFLQSLWRRPALDWPTDSDASKHPLFAWACRNMSRQLIQRLAEWDIGIPEQINLHRAGIVKIIRTGVVPAHLGWEPGECCSLQAHSVELSCSRDRHVINIWSTCVLLIAVSKPDRDGGKLLAASDRIAVLLCSCLALAETSHDAITFMDAMAAALKEHPYHEAPSCLAMLASIILRIRRGDPSAIIEALAATADGREQQEYAVDDDGYRFFLKNDDPPWRDRRFLRLTAHDQKNTMWQQYAAEALQRLEASPESSSFEVTKRLLSAVIGLP